MHHATFTESFRRIHIAVAAAELPLIDRLLVPEGLGCDDFPVVTPRVHSGTFFRPAAPCPNVWLYQITKPRGGAADLAWQEGAGSVANPRDAQITVIGGGAVGAAAARAGYRDIQLLDRQGEAAP